MAMASGSAPAFSMRRRTSATLAAMRSTSSGLTKEAGEVVIATDVEEVVTGGVGEDVATRGVRSGRGDGRRRALGWRNVVEARGDDGDAHRVTHGFVDNRT